MKHRLQMSLAFKKKVISFLIRHPHLSMEGIIEKGMDEMKHTKPIEYGNHSELLPHGFTDQKYVDALSKFIEASSKIISHSRTGPIISDRELVKHLSKRKKSSK